MVCAALDAGRGGCLGGYQEGAGRRGSARGGVGRRRARAKKEIVDVPVDVLMPYDMQECAGLLVQLVMKEVVDEVVPHIVKEEVVDVLWPPVVKEILEERDISQERISERIGKQTADVLLRHDREIIDWIMDVPQKRFPHLIEEQLMCKCLMSSKSFSKRSRTFPRGAFPSASESSCCARGAHRDEIPHGTMDAHQKRISDCIEKRVVDVSVPHVVKEILEGIMDIHQESIDFASFRFVTGFSVRMGEQTVDSFSSTVVCRGGKVDTAGTGVRRAILLLSVLSSVKIVPQEPN